MTHQFDRTALREYDIRGIVGKTMNTADATAIGRGFATRVRRAGGTRVAVGYDGRKTSVALEEALVAGLTAGGVDVVRIGMGPTPMLYYAEATLEVDGGIQITGSHNPAEYNGFKMVLQRRPFFGADIQDLARLATAGDWESGAGGVETVEIMDRYVERLVEGFTGGAYRIGWDAGNGAAGPVIEKLVKLLPGEHHLLFTDVDGDFPNHHPDPTEEKNLADLKALVADKQLDFGLAFDGDGDRIGAIDGLGRVIWGD
ncbi:MAG: phosphomannomutase, partial [Sphingomonas sp.]|nr:phosphomannomutase [Sphingomonas sp.]